MIDVTTEEILSLAEATRALPKIDGKRPHISTLWRWARKGLCGVQLEYVRLGRRICTSREALSRFAQHLAEADGEPAEHRAISKSRPRTEAQRREAVARAEAELEAAGI